MNVQHAPVIHTSDKSTLPIQEQITLSSDKFQGSLIQLVEATKKHQISLNEISLLPFCTSYVEYIIQNNNLQLEESILAYSLLSYLLEKKSSALLAQPSEDEPEEELQLRNTLNEEEIAYITDALMELHEQASKYQLQGFIDDSIYKNRKRVEVTLNPEVLSGLLTRMIEQANHPAPQILSKQRRSLKQMIKLVYASLKPTFTPLSEVMGFTYTKEDCVWWLMSILELIKEGRASVKIQQDEVLFAKI